MKTKFIAALVVCVCALIAIGEVKEPSQNELAEQLLVSMNVPQTTEQVMDIMKEMLPMQMKQMGMPDTVINDQTNEYMKKVMDFTAKEVGWEAMKEDYIALYAESFSKEELEGAIVFYSSDIGQAFIKKQPELMQKSMQISQKKMMAVMPKLQQMMKEFTDEIKENDKPSEKE